MASHRTTILILIAASALLPALSVDAEAPQHVRTAHTFLMAWGNQRWDELRTVATEQVTVRVGDKVFTLEPAAQKSEVARCSRSAGSRPFARTGRSTALRSRTWA